MSEEVGGPVNHPKHYNAHPSGVECITVVEHMGFNGTTHFKKNELVNYLQSIGVRFGADLNA